MFSKKMRFIGISIFVCLAAIIAVPAFAATTGHGFSGANARVMNTTMETKMLGFAENLTTSLQGNVNVDNLDTALNNAQIAIQDSNTTAFRDAMKTFNQDVQAGIKSGSIPKTALQGMGPGFGGFQNCGTTAPALNTAME